jgi:hypothetical protein
VHLVCEQRLSTHHAGSEHRRHWRAQHRKIDLHTTRPRAARHSDDKQLLAEDDHRRGTIRGALPRDDDVHVGERSLIKWPETIHDFATPRMDAAVTIYDVTSQESLAKVPEMLSQ